MIHIKNYDLIRFLPKASKCLKQRSNEQNINGDLLRLRLALLQGIVDKSIIVVIMLGGTFLEMLIIITYFIIIKQQT